MGEAKSGCSANDIFKFLDQKLPADFTITMGDMVAYPAKWDHFKPLAECAGWYMQKYPTWPTIGDQEGRFTSKKSNYPRFYGLPSDSFIFDVGPARFIFLSYFDPPNRGGGQNGRYPTKKSPVLNLDSNTTETLEETLAQARGQNKFIFIFSHAQYYSEGGGTKYYANNPPKDIIKLYQDNAVDIVFQADNPGYSKQLIDGVYYIRNSGIFNTKKKHNFFGFIEVNKERIVYKAIDVSGIIFDQMTISKKNNEN